MNSIAIFLFEWKHFIRSPFKVVALLLFVVAGVYGLHNGANLYDKQTTEIDRIKENVEKERQQYLTYYDEGKKGPESRPWIDLTIPRWAIWYSGVHHFKTPSPALVYSVGQAEQYGFYKKVTYWASPYDSDLTKEIANPERLNTGILDYAFVVLFLLPVLLLILLYNLKSQENEQGFLPLIEVQATAKQQWLLSRVAFYVVIVFVVNIGLIVYGGLLTNVMATASQAIGKMMLYLFLYLLLWSVIYYFILQRGKTILGNTLQMVGIWLILAFIIPATVHQWASLSKPANLMTDFIDAGRDDTQALYDQPDSLTQAQLSDLFPKITESPVYRDSTKRNSALNQSMVALVNELKKASIARIEAENRERNALVQATLWFNPLVLFQSHFNAISQTHYSDYQKYRNEIQTLVDKQARAIVLDTWDEIKVDKAKYLEYNQLLSLNE